MRNIETRREPDPSVMPALIERINEMEGLKDEIDALEDELKVRKERYRDLSEREVPELMETAGITDASGKGKISTGSGKLVYLKTNTFVNVRKDDKPKLFKWLRKEGLGSLIKEDVHHQTLSALVRERLDEDLKIPAFVTVTPQTVAVLHKGSNKG